MPTTTYTEIGQACCEAIIAAVSEVMTERGVTAEQAPAYLSTIAGAALPIADACDGMVWARQAGTMPTDGSGAPFTAARIGWDVPAWAVQIEVGHLWCHQNITEDGGFIDPKLEAGYAERDALWKAIVLEAVAYRWRPRTGDLAAGVMGQSIAPWAPIGPDGGYSGGLVVATVVTSALLLCIETED